MVWKKVRLVWGKSWVRIWVRVLGKGWKRVG